MRPPQALGFGRLDEVALVEDVQRRHIGGAHFLQHPPHGLDVPIALRAGRVDDVQHQVRLGHLFERRAKRRDERVRQPIDESDGVGHQQLPLVRQAHLPHQRIQRDEQRVRRFGRLLRQQIEQRRLAGVGVADERDERHRGLLAPGARMPPPLPDRVDLLRDGVDLLANPPAIGLELRFAGTTRADAAAQPGERRAGADEARQQVLQLRQLDLPLPFARACAPREDVEDELRAIDHLAVDALFDLAQLRGRQLVVEDHDVRADSARIRPPARRACRCR